MGILRARLLEWVGDLPDPEIESRPSTLQADSLPTKPPGKPSEVYGMYVMSHFNSLINICFFLKEVKEMRRN